MKKRLIWILVTCAMLCTMGTGLAQEVKTHLLWDIPFEMEPQAFINAVYEKTGIELEAWKDCEGIHDRITMARGTVPMLFGHQIAIEARYEDDAISIISWGFRSDKGNLFEHEGGYSEEFPVSIAEGLALYQAVLDDFREQYGAPSGGKMRFGEMLKETYNYPTGQDGLLEFKKIVALLSRNVGIRGVIYTYFDNVAVGFFTSYGILGSHVAINIDYDNPENTYNTFEDRIGFSNYEDYLW